MKNMQTQVYKKGKTRRGKRKGGFSPPFLLFFPIFRINIRQTFILPSRLFHGSYHPVNFGYISRCSSK